MKAILNFKAMQKQETDQMYPINTVPTTGLEELALS
jgi:hypothetical protein